jgi:hypothetical protein
MCDDHITHKANLSQQGYSIISHIDIFVNISTGSPTAFRQFSDQILDRLPPQIKSESIVSLQICTSSALYALQNKILNDERLVLP